MKRFDPTNADFSTAYSKAFQKEIRLSYISESEKSRALHKISDLLLHLLVTNGYYEIWYCNKKL